MKSVNITEVKFEVIGYPDFKIKIEGLDEWIDLSPDTVQKGTLINSGHFFSEMDLSEYFLRSDFHESIWQSIGMAAICKFAAINWDKPEVITVEKLNAIYQKSLVWKPKPKP